MLTRLQLHNFKAFERVDVQLRRLTFLLGPNNSGKSSLIAALRLLIQTVDSADPTIPLLLNGNLGDFGTYKDIVFGNYRGRPMDVSLSARIGSGGAESGASMADVRSDLSFKFRKVRRELVLKSSQFAIDGSPYIATEYNNETEDQQVRTIGLTNVPPTLKRFVSERLRMLNFIPQLAVFRAETGESTAASEFLSKQMIDKMRRARTMALHFARYLRSIDYLGARRHPPERTYLFSGERRNRIGSRGENAASIFVSEAGRSRRGKSSLPDDMSRWYESAGIGSGVSVIPLSDRHYELRVRHPVTHERQNIADVGFGNSQVFPVLVGGYTRRPGSTFIVEEPEIHLHPRAQAALGDFFAELYEREVNAIVETHSEHMMVRIQQHVAAGRIKPEDVVVYYIMPEGEVKSAKRLELNSGGYFLDEWPEGFFPERLAEARALAKLRHERDQKVRS